jgi:hypothetical protein
MDGFRDRLRDAPQGVREGPAHDGLTRVATLLCAAVASDRGLVGQEELEALTPENAVAFVRTRFLAGPPAEAIMPHLGARWDAWHERTVEGLFGLFGVGVAPR